MRATWQKQPQLTASRKTETSVLLLQGPGLLPTTVRSQKTVLGPRKGHGLADALTAAVGDPEQRITKLCSDS